MLLRLAYASAQLNNLLLPHLTSLTSDVTAPMALSASLDSSSPVRRTWRDLHVGEKWNVDLLEWQASAKYLDGINIIRL